LVSKRRFNYRLFYFQCETGFRLFIFSARLASGQRGTQVPLANNTATGRIEESLTTAINSARVKESRESNMVKLGDNKVKSGNKYIWYECPQCQEQRWVRATLLKGTNFTGLCHACNSKNQLPPDALNKGPAHASWKGGRTYHEKGYIRIWLPPDDFFFPMTGNRNGYGGYVFEHRLVIAQHLHRCLLPWEIVHHKGTKYPQDSKENRQDNRWENLDLMPIQAEHLPSIATQRRLNKLELTVSELEKQNRLLKWQIKELLKERSNVNECP